MRLKDIVFSNIYKRIPAFGLDVSDFSIKIVQLEKKEKGFELRTHNRTSIPEGIIKGGNIEQEDKLIEILKKTIDQVKGEPMRIPYAVCSLPEQHCFVKVIQLPKMKTSEAKEAIKWEAEANIPLSLEEVYLDWEIIPSKKDTDYLKVLINAAPKVLVDKYLQVLRKSGIEPIIFEIESVATARSLIKAGFSPKPVLIMDLGFSRTSFIIFTENSILFTSSISVSNQQMINDIAKKLKISQKEAQELKFKIGLDKTKKKGRIFNALSPSMIKLIEQIKNCIAFYKEHEQEQNYSEDISEIILCGGGTYLKGLPEYISDRLKIPVVLGDPLINLNSSTKNINTIRKESLAYSTAIGLALRGANI